MEHPLPPLFKRLLVHRRRSQCQLCLLFDQLPIYSLPVIWHSRLFFWYFVKSSFSRHNYNNEKRPSQIFSIPLCLFRLFYFFFIQCQCVCFDNCPIRFGKELEACFYLRVFWCPLVKAFCIKGSKYTSCETCIVMDRPAPLHFTHNITIFESTHQSIFHSVAFSKQWISIPSQFVKVKCQG